MAMEAHDEWESYAKVVARWVESLKTRHQLSDEALARSIGVSWRTVYRWRHGEVLPELRNIRAIYDRYGELPPHGGKLYSANFAPDQHSRDSTSTSGRRKAMRTTVLLAAAFVTLQLGASHADTPGTNQKGYVSACPRKDLHGVRALGIRREGVVAEHAGQILSNRCDRGSLAPAEPRAAVALGDDTRHEGVAVLHDPRPADAEKQASSTRGLRRVHAGSGDGRGKSRPRPSQAPGAKGPSEGPHGAGSKGPPGGGPGVRPDGQRDDAHIPLRRPSANRMSDSQVGLRRGGLAEVQGQASEGAGGPA